MTHVTAPTVICLRPEEDFLSVGIKPPGELNVVYGELDELDDDVLSIARAIVLASVGSPVSLSSMERLPALELVQFTGAGIDRAGDLNHYRPGIAVANVPAANAREVAEYVLFAAGALLRRLAFADREVRAGRYAQARAQLGPSTVRSIHARTVGVIGMGNIGFAVARLLCAAGARVVYHDPAPSRAREAQELGLERIELGELLANCDVVTLHVPLLEATRGLIGEKQLRAMPPGAVLINASRGGVVDEAALAAVLSEGHLGGAAVDVYSQEPPPADSPLLRLAPPAGDLVLFTPHIAGVAYEAAQGLYSEAWANVYRVLVKGEAVRHQVWPRAQT